MVGRKRDEEEDEKKEQKIGRNVLRNREGRHRKVVVRSRGFSVVGDLLSERGIGGNRGEWWLTCGTGLKGGGDDLAWR